MKRKEISYDIKLPPLLRRIDVRVGELVSWVAGGIYGIFAALGITGGGTLAGMGGAWAFISTALAYGVVGGALFAAQSLLNKPKDQSSTTFSQGGLLLNTQAVSDPIRIVYGETRIGGTRVFAHTTGFLNRKLHLIIVWGEGPMASPKTDGLGEMIYFDGERIQTWQAWQGKNLAFHEFHSGTLTQTVSTELQGYFASWNDAMRGTAYSYFRLSYSQTAWTRLPEITMCPGKRSVFDPRTGLTAASDNPALVWFDFKTHPRYGGGVAGHLANSQSVIDAASWCDTNLYHWIGAIAQRQPFLDNMEVLMLNFKAGQIWSAGKYKLLIQKWDTPVMTLSENDIEIINEGRSNALGLDTGNLQDVPKRIKVIFSDPTDNYLIKYAFWPEAALDAAETDKADLEIDLIGTADFAQALRLAKFHYLRSQYPLTYNTVSSPSVRTDSYRVIGLEPGDLVQVSHDTNIPASSIPSTWSLKVLRVRDCGLTQEEKISLVFNDEDDDIYDETVDVATHASFSTTLPGNTDTPDYPENLGYRTGSDELTASQVDTYLELYCDRCAIDGYDYEFRYKKSTGKTWTTVKVTDYVPLAWQALHAYTVYEFVIPTVQIDVCFECTTAGTSGASEPSWDTRPGYTTSSGSTVWTCRATSKILTRIGGLPGNTEYNWEVRTIDNKNTSVWIIPATTATTWAPGAPSGTGVALTATSKKTDVHLVWTDPTSGETLIDKWVIYRSDDSNVANAYELHRSGRGEHSFYDKKSVSGHTWTEGHDYYYGLKIFDKWNQYSAMIGWGAHAACTKVDTVDETAPSQPTDVSLNVALDKAGKNLVGYLVWDASIDAEGNLAGYEWEVRDVNASASIVIGTDGNDYKCILDHQSSNVRKPITGAQWQRFWEDNGTTGLGVPWKGSLHKYVDDKTDNGKAGHNIQRVKITLPANDSFGVPISYKARVRGYDRYENYSLWSDEYAPPVSPVSPIPPPPPVSGGINLLVSQGIIYATLTTTLPATYLRTDWYFSDVPNFTADQSAFARSTIGRNFDYPAKSSWQGKTIYVKATIVGSADQESSLAEGSVYVPPFSTITPVAPTPSSPPVGTVVPLMKTFPEIIGPTESHLDWTTDCTKVPGYSWTDEGTKASQTDIRAILNCNKYYAYSSMTTGCYLLAGTSPGGKVLRTEVAYNEEYGSVNWIDQGQLGSETAVYCFAYVGLREVYSGDYRVALAGTGPGGKIYRSIDSGATWTSMGQLGSATKVLALSYCENGIFLAGTDEGHIYKSTDYGLTWDDIGQLGTATSVNCLEYCGNGIVFAGTSSGGKLYKSTDYGATWEDMGQIGGKTDIFCLRHTGPDTLYILFVGAGNTIYRSADGGVTFPITNICTGETSVLSIEYLCDGILVAGTNGNGKIYRTTDLGISGWTDLGQQATESKINSIAWIGDGYAVAGTSSNGKILNSKSLYISTETQDKMEGNASIKINIPGGADYLNKYIKTIDLVDLDYVPTKLVADTDYVYIHTIPKVNFTPELIIHRISKADKTLRKDKIIGQVNPYVIGMAISGTNLYVLSTWPSSFMGYRIPPISTKAMLTVIDLSDFTKYQTIVLDYDARGTNIIPIANSLAVNGDYVYVILLSKDSNTSGRIFKINRNTFIVETYLDLTSFEEYSEPNIPIEVDATNIYIVTNYSGGVKYWKIPHATMVVGATKTIAGDYVSGLAINATYLYATGGSQGYRRLQIADWTTNSAKASGLGVLFTEPSIDSSYIYGSNGSDTVERLLLSDFNTLGTKTGFVGLSDLTGDATYLWIADIDANSILTLRQLTKSGFTTLSSQTYGFRNLTGLTHIKLWMKVGRKGSYYKLWFGESAVNEQSYLPIVFTYGNVSGIWQEVLWDISAIANASKDAVRYFGFQILNTDVRNYVLIDPAISGTTIDPVFVSDEGEQEWIILGRFFNTGNDADKDPSPKRGMQYYATDVTPKKLYICFSDGSWISVEGTSMSIDYYTRALVHVTTTSNVYSDVLNASGHGNLKGIKIIVPTHGSYLKVILDGTTVMEVSGVNPGTLYLDDFAGFQTASYGDLDWNFTTSIQIQHKSGSNGESTETFVRYSIS